MQNVWRRLTLLAAASLLVLAQYSPTQPLTPETLLLARIRVVMSENLENLPNYTCTMEIERSRRRARSKRFESQDLLRIEVAYVGGKELYAWPGSSQFEERQISDMVQGGTSSSGEFALHAKSVFLTTVPSFTYQGRTSLGDVPAHKFAFQVPRLSSGYTLRISPAEGIAGYHGVAYNRSDTLDLMRLELEVDDIPSNVPVERAHSVIEYQRVPIGGATFLLPKSADLTIVDLSGEESRNRTSFSNCRQFTGESVLTFEDPPESISRSNEPAVTITLPPDADLFLKITNVESKGRTAIGDHFEAQATRAIRHKGEEYLAKGARIEGRITHYQRLAGPDTLYLIGFRPERFSFSNKTGAVDASLQSPSFNMFLGAGYRNRLSGVRVPTGLPRNVGYFVVSREDFVLPSGLEMIWRTLEGSGAARQ